MHIHICYMHSNKKMGKRLQQIGNLLNFITIRKYLGPFLIFCILYCPF